MKPEAGAMSSIVGGKKGSTARFIKKSYKNTITPSVKQVKALQLINQGYSIYRAMREAGYSRWTSMKGRKFFKYQGVQQAIISLQSYLTKAGVNNETLANKLVELLQATKIDHSHTEPDKVVPDYDTQIKAFDRANEVLNKEAVGKNAVKRKLTIEEFVLGDEATEK